MKDPRDNLLNLRYTDQEDLLFKRNNKKLLILLHGMYSTPSTFEDYAAHCEQSHPELDIYCPALPAGTKDINVLAEIGPWTWTESVIVAKHKVLNIAKNYESIILGGHSQGGSISLELAASMDIFKGLIIIASPLDLYSSSLSWDERMGIVLSDLLCVLIPKGITKQVPYSKERQACEKICDAEGLIFPLTISTFKRGLKALRPRLENINIPLFIAYCRQDRLVDPKNAQILAQAVHSPIIVHKIFDVPKKQEPYGRKHHLLNYTETRQELTHQLDYFLNSF